MITPESLAACGTEDGHQMAVFAYASAQPDLRWKLLFAIPNGGYRDKRTGGKLKATGVKRGVPDMMLPVPIKYLRRNLYDDGIDRLCYHGLFIELKIKSGTVSDDQKRWIRDLTDQDYKCMVCWSWKEAVQTIERYLRGEL